MFFEGCEGNAVGKTWRGPHRARRGNPVRSAGARVGKQRSRAGTRCNSLETGARSKPPRWESNHAGGTRRVGWHRPAEGGNPGSGRAPGKSVRHSANEPSASETRWHEQRRLGSGRSVFREERGATPGGGRGGRQVELACDHTAMCGVSSADSPGDTLTRVDRPGARGGSSDRPVRAPQRASVGARQIRHCIGTISGIGGVCANTARRRRGGRDGVAPRSTGW